MYSDAAVLSGVLDSRGRCIAMLLFSCTEQFTCTTLCMLFPGISLLTA